MKFIYLYGPDGAGKSTQARLIVKVLRLKGLKVKRVLIRSKHYPFRILWNFLRLTCGEPYVYPGGYVTKVPKRTILQRISTFIVYAELLNALALTFIVQLYLRLGYVIVAERYLLDSFTDFLYFFKNIVKKRPIGVLKILFAFIPRDMIFIFLDADYQTLWKRYKKRGSIPEPEDYIAFQRAVGKVFSQRFNPNITIFTPKNTIIQTHSLIINVVFKEEI
ncbi:hypothetical protein IMZ38_01165 [Thermosphaera chiliense]|uniref:Thymidylate kinase n=1 Tax=Thermosphaera chiliense TaxID=3402707 RepID=A0A7M1UQQ0_9CREN|nr:hypothetical protein [Thermosphaera aggregans]QOR94578.1 hypothetical protein IMZ38_01165 [Thermosphaera aggregans]